MNALRIFSRVLAVSAVVCVSSASAHLDQVTKLIVTGFSNDNVQNVMNTAAGCYIGKIAVDGSEKSHPVFIAVATGLLVNACTKNPEAGAIAGLASLGLSAATSVAAAHVEAPHSVKKAVGHVIEPNNAVMLATALAATAAGYYMAQPVKKGS